MGLTRLSVRRPLTMLMIILALVVLGYKGFTSMQVDRFPKVDFPFVTVVSVFPGASPEDVEDLLVKPIEDAVSGISGVDYVSSISNEGVAFVIIAFLESVDADQAALDVQRQVATIKGTLPDDATEPSIVKADINALPILKITLNGPQSQDELFKLAEDEVKPRLEAVKGVASLSISGGREKIIAVQFNPQQLAAYHLPADALSQRFMMNNMTFPVGSIEEGRQKSSIRSLGSFQSLSEIENMVISGGAPGGQPAGPPGGQSSGSGGLVYLRNVASIAPSYKDVSVHQRFNGQDTVAISIVKSTDANVIDVADSVKRKVEALNKDLPGGAQLSIVTDDSNFIRNSVNAVTDDLMLAVLITGLVMLVFLHTIRSTFIVLLAIPTSLFSTFLVMWALGFTLNVLTLLALTLIIGILVDDSIVVLENIERHLKMKKDPKQAAIDGRREIGMAAIAITLTDVVVYVPVAFTSGIVGQFFRSYGITITIATLFSLFVSFTLTPMLAAYWMKDEREEDTPRGGAAGLFNTLMWPVNWVWDHFINLWEYGWDKLASLYAFTLRLSLKNFLTQLLVVVISLLIFGASLLLIPKIGFEMMPQEDDGRVQISVEMPPGTTLDVTNEVAKEVEQIALQETKGELVSILTRAGSSSASLFTMGRGGGSNNATVSLQLVNKNNRNRSLDEVVEALRPKVSKIPDATIKVETISFMGGAGGNAINIQVTGADPDVLLDLSNQIEHILRTTPGAVDVVNNGANRAPENKIILNRQRLTDLGLSPAQVAGTLRTAVTGSDVGDYAPEGAEKIEINLRADENARENMDKLLQMPIGYSGNKPVLLAQVAEIERSLAPSTIDRYNRQRILAISAGSKGSDSGGLANRVEERIKNEVIFPPDYSYRFIGMTEQQREAFTQLGSALGLSIILIYMLLVGLYQNFLQPLAIMFALPLSLIGVLGGLYLTGNTMNIFSLLGIIMLAGVVTRNAILIIDFANQLQEGGMERKAALVEAGRLRLRPIAMTANTLIFALLPVLLSTADGSESRQPLAAVLMGGSVTSGLLSLIFIPVIYNAFENLNDWIGAIWRWLSGKPAVQPAPETSPPTEA